MTFSLTSLLTAVLFSNIFIVLLGFLFHRSNMVIRVGTKIVFACVGILFLRLLIPYEFSFTKSIYLTEVFPYITGFFRAELFFVPINGFCVYHIFLVIWVVGSVVHLSRLIKGHLAMKQVLKVVDEVQSPKLDEMIRFINEKHNSEQEFKVMKVASLATPIITGLVKPTIIIPEGDVNAPHLYYAILHEMTHFFNRDLWKKQFFAVLCAIYWWNPCVWILSNIFNKTIELNADYSLTRDMDEEEVYKYLECLIETSKRSLNSPRSSLAFAGRNVSTLQQRFEFILESRQGIKRKPYRVGTIIFALVMLFLSFTIIIEPSFAKSLPENANETFSLDNVDIYLIERNDAYEIYENGVHTITIDNMQESFESFPVYKNESEVPK